MESYIGSKIINAEPMDHDTFMAKIKNQPPAGDSENAPGYHVVYNNDYHSWSP